MRIHFARAAGLLALLGAAAAARAQDPADPATAILDALARGDAAGSITDCVLEPSEQVTISSPIPGVIHTIHVERGDRVRKGAPIATLRSELERAQVKLREARVRFAQRKLRRNEELYKEDLISEHELDEIKTELELAEVELEEARVILAQKRIASPFDGIVFRRHQSPGQYVTNEPIVTLVSIDRVNAEVMLPAAMLARVTPGAEIVIEPEFPAGARHVGRIAIIDRIVDPASGTFGIRAILDNPGQAITAGVHCQASLAGS
jgi:RND family efflux transporter MFP subunit